MKPVFWHWCMTLMERLLEMLHISESNFKQLCQTWNVSVWFRIAPVGRCLPPSDTSVRSRTESSSFGHYRMNQGTAVWFRTLSSDFGHYRPISATAVRFLTIPSDFRRNWLNSETTIQFRPHCPISDSTVQFQTLLSDLEHYIPMSVLFHWNSDDN